MKGIYIYGVDTKQGSLYLEDDDDTDLTVYTKRLTALLSSDNVIILETTDGNAILRPNKINAIFVRELEGDHSMDIENDEETLEQIKNMEIIDLEPQIIVEDDPESPEEEIIDDEDVVSDEEE